MSFPSPEKKPAAVPPFFSKNVREVVTFADRRAVYALLYRMLDWLPAARLSTVRDGVSKPGVGEWRRCDRCAATGRVVGDGASVKPCRGMHTSWPFGHGCRQCACQDGWVKIGRQRRTKRVSRVVTCWQCDGEREILIGDVLSESMHWQQCGVCEATGKLTVEEEVPDDSAPEGSDRMLSPGKHSLHDDAMTKAEKRRWVDAQIIKIAALQRQHDGTEAPADDLSRALEAKAHLYRTGSFQTLELALEMLSIAYPLRHDSVRLFVIEGQYRPDAGTRLRLDETVDWLAARMTGTIHLPGDARDEMDRWKHSLQHGRTPEHGRQRAARNLEIIRLRDEHGWSLRRIGDLYSLSGETVRGIVQPSIPVATAAA